MTCRLIVGLLVDWFDCSELSEVDLDTIGVF